MPTVRKKKIPVTSSKDDPPSSSNPHSSRTLIRKFHVLLKKQEQLKRTTSSTSNHKELVDVQQEIDDLGGLAAYQRMSSIGQGKDRGGGSEKVLIGWLKERRASPKEGHNKLRLLEVGALKPDNYDSCASWIAVTPIDLRSRHPSILEQDFLLMDEADHREKWDVISLSLVVNYVPEPKDRGRMLCLSHTMLAPDGLLYLALPLPCVENSRYLTFDALQALMTAIGFVQVKERWKKGGKMAYWLYTKGVRDDLAVDQFRKKEVCRQGNRNNFVITLQ